jgi:hypothetical protein
MAVTVLPYRITVAIQEPIAGSGLPVRLDRARAKHFENRDQKKYISKVEILPSFSIGNKLLITSQVQFDPAKNREKTIFKLYPHFQVEF